MHHHPPNQERALILSILPVSGPALQPYFPRNPRALVFRKLPAESYKELLRMASWHRLWLELGRYLIAFEPLTFVLDQRKRSWQMLSHRFVLRRSKNFTSNVATITPLPRVLKTNKMEPRSYSIIPCTQYSGDQRPALSTNLFKPHRQDVRTGQLSTDKRRTDRPRHTSDYELFNRNNFNIRYWSWNYCGCWHQTCPPIDPR
ncbi:hypothetical protein J437_LFUL010737 [Ladona fulva]|uniref:Uncharacterized protein n=1 Tax=Ladona fulva TaxID=123851 RepID=A0A8K0KC92_LADFU|nr:hypothetical protein J437_LFUL010737 [Ladona fulva]